MALSKSALSLIVTPFSGSIEVFDLRSFDPLKFALFFTSLTIFLFVEVSPSTILRWSGCVEFGLGVREDNKLVGAVWGGLSGGRSLVFASETAGIVEKSIDSVQRIYLVLVSNKKRKKYHSPLYVIPQLVVNFILYVIFLLSSYLFEYYTIN